MPMFLIFIQKNGEERIKLRISEKDLISGSDLANAILRKLSIETDGEAVEVYDTKMNAFVLLRDQSEVVPKFGTKLLCSLNYYYCRDGMNNNNTLSIQGRYFPYDNGMTISTTTTPRSLFVEVHERFDELGAGTGLNIWDGAILLVKYLEQNQHLIGGKHVLELGSGCGLVGIVAAILGAKSTILTDLPYAMDLLEKNVARNSKLFHKNTEVCCRIWDWYDETTAPEEGKQRTNIVLLADCIWIQELVPPLVNTLKRIIINATATNTNNNNDRDFCILVSYQRRGQTAHDLFWNSMKELFVTVECMDIISSEIIDKPDTLNIFKLSGIRTKL